MNIRARLTLLYSVLFVLSGAALLTITYLLVSQTKRDLVFRTISEPGVPPPFTDWRYDDTPWGTRRNLGGYRVSDVLMRRHATVISGHAAAWRLGSLVGLSPCWR